MANEIIVVPKGIDEPSPSQQPVVVKNEINLPAPASLAWYQQNILFVPILAVVISAWVAHKFTQKRDWEKVVADSYSRLENQVNEACATACDAWSSPKGPKRAAAIAATIWRVQQIGQSIASIERNTRRRRWKRKMIVFPYFRQTQIVASQDMIAFRQSITNDPFNDLSRRADNAKIVTVENAKGELLTALNQHWIEWNSV